MSADKEHWFIDNLVLGPYQDELGQDFFLARVSGLDSVDGILWGQQHLDIPQKLIHTFLESLHPEAAFGNQPAQVWLAAADTNAM